MKIRLLRRLRRKAKKKYRLVQIGKGNYVVRQYYSDNTYYPIYWIGGYWPLSNEALNKIYNLRRDYILRKVKEMRNIYYPKVIDI